MNDKIYRLTFEIVRPTQANLDRYYCGCGEHPAVDPATIPEEAWTTVDKQESLDDIADQAAGLAELITSGEFVRNVHIWEADAPQWREFQP